MATVGVSQVCTSVTVSGSVYPVVGQLISSVSAVDATTLTARENLPRIAYSTPGSPATLTIELQPEISSITFAGAGTLAPVNRLITLPEPEGSTFIYGPSFGKQHIPFVLVTT